MRDLRVRLLLARDYCILPICRVGFSCKSFWSFQLAICFCSSQKYLWSCRCHFSPPLSQSSD